MFSLNFLSTVDFSLSPFLVILEITPLTLPCAFEIVIAFFTTFFVLMDFAATVMFFAFTTTGLAFFKGGVVGLIILFSPFVADVTEPELIQYLKERQLYINEEVQTEEEM